MDVDYFLNQLSLPEVYDYIRGQDRRHRTSWEQTRMICRVISKCMTGANLEMSFPWDSGDEEKNEPEITEEERERLHQRAKALEKIFKDKIRKK